MVKIKWKTYKTKFDNKYILHIRTAMCLKKNNIYVLYFFFKSNTALIRTEFDDSDFAIWSSYGGARSLGGSWYCKIG
jgi:hypothetical protein